MRTKVHVFLNIQTSSHIFCVLGASLKWGVHGPKWWLDGRLKTPIIPNENSEKLFGTSSPWHHPDDWRKSGICLTYKKTPKSAARTIEGYRCCVHSTKFVKNKRQNSSQKNRWWISGRISRRSSTDSGLKSGDERAPTLFINAVYKLKHATGSKW